MGKILIVSNRLPFQFSVENKDIVVNPSVGGLATGMKSIHAAYDSKWVGWTGLEKESLDENLKIKVSEVLKKEDCIDVPLSKKEVDLFYFGFSNKTIWPLFHYFTEFTEYGKEEWDTYYKVNQKFADAILTNIQEGDKVWIHDYQLLLVPKMIRDKRPDVSIGFFLHIPFPSFEIIRILPWRKEILEGILGADLIGFHTFDYERHFFSSVRRLLGYDIRFNEIQLNDRIVKADSFPMGIDYDRFHNASLMQQQLSIKDKTEVKQQLDKHQLMSPELKFILSIDRLDYTKGIAKRLIAFEYFLEKYPEYLGKVTLIMLCVPSRANVRQYQKMKKEIDELVGRINGKYSKINWTPIWYFYRSMPFENLIDLYSSSDVALITPIRDGMNLVAKEYIASRINKKGVLILSEMAGAAKEMSEALVINPNNNEEIAKALHEALTMPEEEQIERNIMLQDRLKRYNIDKWATDFMNALVKLEQKKNNHFAKKIDDVLKNTLANEYKNAKKRMLFLDYDGTLVDFKDKPIKASPDEELYTLLDKLSRDPANELVLISGRDRETFSTWFQNKNYSMIVEHGVWSKKPEKDWVLLEQLDVSWKEKFKHVIDFYVDRTPGTFIEEKNYSLVWHFRKADPELGIIRANELKDKLNNLIANHGFEIMEGNKVIEIKNNGIN